MNLEAHRFCLRSGWLRHKESFKMDSLQAIPRMPSLNRPLAILIAGFCLSTMQPPARAHAIQSSLSYLDGTLELSSSFSTGLPAEGAVVRLLKADGTPGEELGRIDAEGKLGLHLPELQEGIVDLQVDGGPGHRDYLALPIRSGQVNLEEVVQQAPGFPATNPLAWAGSSPLLLGLVGLLVSVRPSARRS